MVMPKRLTSLSTSNMILFWITIISIIVQASLLPLADDDDKRTGHSIMRFGRQAGHNILRFGRTPGHNMMRFGKREESNSVPGSSYEMLSEQRPSAYLNDYQSIGDGPDFNTNQNADRYYGQIKQFNIPRSFPGFQPAKKGRPETDHVIMRFG